MPQDPPGNVAPPPPITVTTSVSDAPTIYADLLYHIAWLNGVARLAFVRNDTDVPTAGRPTFHGQHVISIAMPMASVVAMRDYLSDNIAEWEKAPPQSGQG